MVKNIIYLDVIRQEEIHKFYDACQMHRYYYKGYPNANHPLTYFREPEYSWQCPPDMSPVYLSYPSYHVRYKHPTVLPGTTERSSGMPSLPSRTLAPRYNKAACKLFASQRHREYYKGYPKAYHPLTYFRDPVYMWQCPPEMTPVYLNYPNYHVKYKQPLVLPSSTGRTTTMPALPSRTLAGRFNKAACKLFVR